LCPRAIAPCQLTLLVAAVVYTTGRDTARVQEPGVHTNVEVPTSDRLDQLSNRLRWPNAVCAGRACGKDTAQLFIANVCPVTLCKGIPGSLNPLGKMVAVDCVV